MKQVIVLVGPKGSGKTSIGTLLEEELRIKFIRVEPLFLQLRAEMGPVQPGDPMYPDYERAGFQKVLARLNNELAYTDTICFESTGASEQLNWLLAELGAYALVLPVQVQADSHQCLERIHSRDSSIHIPVSDDQVERINALASMVELNWAGRIDNRGEFNRRVILETIQGLLGGKRWPI